jgi:tetratricopeptide (TPR) repeat protein
VRWIEDERTQIERLSDLEVAVHSWEQSGCRAKDLPTGTLLAHYLQSAGTLSPPGTQVRKLSERAARYLEAARRNERRRTLNRWALGLGSLLAGGALLVTTTWGLEKDQQFQTLFQQAVNNVNEIVSADWQHSRHAVSPAARKQELERNRKQAAELFAKRPDLQSLSSYITSIQRLSDFAFEHETLARAESLLDEARALIDEALAPDANNRELRSLRAMDHSKRGKIVLAKGGLLQEVEGHFSKALEFFGCQSSRLETEGDQQACATSFLEHADVKRRTQHIQEALRLYDPAIRLLKQALEQNPGAYNQALLAEARGARAEASQDPALMVLARIHLGLAGLQDAQGKSDAAASYKEAQLLGQQLHEREKSNKRYALVLAESLRGLEPTQPSLRQKRCGLVDDFLRKDPEDARFKALSEGCPEKIGGRE